jgi:hypothetical protein
VSKYGCFGFSMISSMDSWVAAASLHCRGSAALDCSQRLKLTLEENTLYSYERTIR